ncbi:hypothetical protein ACEZ3G_10545 [Maribacter algicola]|uniref:Uncharacterized protein n=1 Tax=Meishania litoralis TaxID=3434685 RepID=A0ACC7LK37_9FLAO
MKPGNIKITLYLLFLYASVALGQTTAGNLEKKQIKVQQYTVMERFDPNLVLPVEDRIQLKKDRIVEFRRTKELLDTLSISKRKKRKLMRDLRRSPIFTERLNKVVAENTLEDNE